jgi:aspartyl-tRNA(Asn)/glutamyl-tRNA(Gln) amidotransferase subunit A
VIIGNCGRECVAENFSPQNTQIAEKNADRKIELSGMRACNSNFRTLAEAAELIRTGKISPVELLQECLKVIEQLNPIINTFATVTAESAIAQAKLAEREVRSGNWRGSLHGIPIGLKDLIDTAGVRTTAGSAVFRDRIPAEDAVVVNRLKAAGAVLIGKHNLHEFAYGGSSLISHFGPVRNPVNPEFIAGGSSGGSAAAVASGMCYAAVGTDTAGSIREPAALCGIVGLKPTYGLVSTGGIIPLSPSLDYAGPIARTVEDAAIVLDAICERSQAKSYRDGLKDGIGSLTIGIPRKFFFDELHGEVAASVEGAIQYFVGQVKKVREIDLPIDTDRTVQQYEAYTFHREMVARSPESYHPETLRRILTGEHITDEQYRVARQELERVRKDIGRHFTGIDLVLTPTTPIPAPRVSELLQDISRLRPVELMLLRNTRPGNVWGLPAMSVPCGTTSEGLPIGLQIMGLPNKDRKVLCAAYAYEQRSSS